jgi:two-component system, chemotaxis family, chemotaxis protein CheY
MSFKFEKLSMLVVEDTPPMQKLLVSVLDALGIKKVQTCNHGEDAFRAFVQNNHDIILSDWQMSPVNGIELTAMIRKGIQSPNKMVPIILITGYSAWSRVEEARDVGVTEFLVKPFTANDLARRIAHVINKPRDFIETQDFFGPDRRRRNYEASGYKGPMRRGDDGRQSYELSDVLFRGKE